jgi:hypothetical protein
LVLGFGKNPKPGPGQLLKRSGLLIDFVQLVFLLFFDVNGNTNCCFLKDGKPKNFGRTDFPHLQLWDNKGKIVEIKNAKQNNYFNNYINLKLI